MAPCFPLRGGRGDYVPPATPLAAFGGPGALPRTPTGLRPDGGFAPKPLGLRPIWGSAPDPNGPTDRWGLRPQTPWRFAPVRGKPRADGREPITFPTP